MRTGDNVRICTLYKEIANICKEKIYVFNLNHKLKKYTFMKKDKIIYINVPRAFYNLLCTLTSYNNLEDLNPLVKITHYIDEFLTMIKLKNWIRNNAGGKYKLFVSGSMTLASFFMKLLRFREEIIYDPLANYAQTLYLRSRKSFIQLIKYGLYVLLHKLQLKTSKIVLYPSEIDSENAIRMFKIRNNRKIKIVHNPYPICFNSRKEYEELRSKRKDFSKPYFTLLAGSRNPANEEAVKLTIEVFNKHNPEKYHLIITGPWMDMRIHVKNPSIQLPGVVTHKKLKEVLAISDYGLAPIFSHAAGTFLKTLAYIAAELDIIATPQALLGIPKNTIKNLNIYTIKTPKEYNTVVKKILQQRESVQHIKTKGGHIITCNDAKEVIRKNIKAVIR